MLSRNLFLLVLIAAFLSTCRAALGGEISIEGAPADSGYNVGSVATIRATVKGIAGDVSRYAVFAEIQYAGTTSTTSVQMDRVAEPGQGEARYEVGWPIPAEAPTGLTRSPSECKTARPIAPSPARLCAASRPTKS